MSDSFKLLGSYEVTPQGNPLSFAPNIAANISEGKTLAAKEISELNLADDSPLAVPFGGVVNANIVILKAIGGKVTAALTSTDGSSQHVPFDTYFILMSDSVPITALTLTRVAGTPTTVRVFLAEEA